MVVRVDFCDFGIFINFQCGSPASWCIYYLFPHWGPEDLVRSNREYMSFYMYVSLYLCVSLCLSVWSYVSIFGNNKSAARNCAVSMRPQATGSNPLSSIIKFPSIQSSTCLLKCFVFVLKFQCGVQRRDAFIPTLGSRGPQWGLFKFIYLYVSLYLCLVVSVTFWWS